MSTSDGLESADLVSAGPFRHGAGVVIRLADGRTVPAEVLYVYADHLIVRRSGRIEQHRYRVPLHPHPRPEDADP